MPNVKYLTKQIQSVLSSRLIYRCLIYNSCKSASSLTQGLHLDTLKLTNNTSQKMPEHLAQGSTEPPLSPGKLRLYGMRFCPYDQRVHLVLLAKNITHENVWINLKSKPDWFLEKVPSAKVPGLVVDSQVLFESLIIADFLDEKYPQRPLHRKDPLEKAKDRLLIELFSKVTSAFMGVVKAPGPEEIDALIKELLVFDKELADRKTNYFGGDQPGMVDYMIWPWFERFRAGKEVFGKTFDIPESKLKHLVPWINAMLEDPVVKEYLVKPEDHAKFMKSFMAGTPEYNMPV